jgi:hypothetical protein
MKRTSDDRLWIVVIQSNGQEYEAGRREEGAARDFADKAKKLHPDWRVTVSMETL